MVARSDRLPRANFGSVPLTAREWLGSVWRRRDLIRLLVIRDLKLRYKGSVLGFLWTLLNPLLTIGIFSVVFSRLFGAYYEQYKLYMISGVLFWTFFSLTTSQGLRSIVNQAQIIRKISVPKLVFPISVVCSNFVNLLFSLLAIGLFIPLAGGHYTLRLLWLPLVLLLLFGFTLGLVLILSTVTVFLRDMTNIWEVLIMIWFFLTPVFYPRSVIPPEYAFLLRFNPMVVILEICRLPIYLGMDPPVGLFAKAFLGAVISIILGLLLFRRYEDRFVYFV